MTQDIEQARLLDDMHALIRQHEAALDLLGDMFATFRLPANRVTIAKSLPQLEPILDSFIHRYARLLR